MASDSLTVTGKLVAKFDEVQRSATFKTREFVIEKSDSVNQRLIVNYIKFQCVQDKTSLPDRANIGDEVTVSFNLRGSKYNKNGEDAYITNLDAWRLEVAKLGGTVTNNEMPPPPTMPTFEESDDLPF